MGKVEKHKLKHIEMEMSLLSAARTLERSNGVANPSPELPRAPFGLMSSNHVINSGGGLEKVSPDAHGQNRLESSGM